MTAFRQSVKECRRGYTSSAGSASIDPLERLRASMERPGNKTVWHAFSEVSNDPLARVRLEQSDFAKVLAILTNQELGSRRRDLFGGRKAGGGSAGGEGYSSDRAGKRNKPGNARSSESLPSCDEESPDVRALRAVRVLQTMVASGFDPANGEIDAVVRLLRQNQMHGHIASLVEEMSSLGVKVDNWCLLQALLASCKVGDVERAMVFCKECEFRKPGTRRFESQRPGLAPSHWRKQDDFDRIIGCFARHNDARSAAEVFDALENLGWKAGFRIYTTLIALHGRCRLPTEAGSWFKRALRAGITPDEKMYNTLLDCYANLGDTERMKGIIASMRRLNIRPSVWAYTALMKAYINQGLPLNAVQEYQTMLSDGVHPDTYASNYLIKAHLLDDNIREAEAALARMGKPIEGSADANDPPDASTFATLITYHLRRNNVDRALALQQQMTSCQVPLNIKLGASLMNAYARAGDAQAVFATFQDMCSRNIRPDAAVFNALIWTHVHTLNDPESARRILKDMENHGLKPDVYTFNIFLHGLVKHGRLHEGLDFLRAFPVPPNVVSYTTVIDALAKVNQGGNLEGPVQLFRDMEKNDDSEMALKADAVAYTVMVDAHGRRADLLPVARAFFDEMRERGIRPDTAAYNALAAANARFGTPASTMAVVSEMMEDKIKPDVRTFTTLIASVTRHEKQNLPTSLSGKRSAPTATIPVFQNMIQAGVSPDAVSFAALLQTFTNRRDHQSAKRLVTEMKSRFGITPTPEVYTALVKACEDDTPAIARMMIEMIQAGVVPDRKILEFCEKALVEVNTSDDGVWSVKLEGLEWNGRIGEKGVELETPPVREGGAR
ncbi:hypothetical protein HK104_008170 [Borealophlyctis nickersoniae]|nr:hypothetical protein HK104_008170 [Borealophlyctis nickersoniae]